MKIRILLVSSGMLALGGCASNSSFTTANTDEASLKGSPAGVATFGFLDLLNILPVNLTSASYGACISPSVSGTTTTLAYHGCSSASGGTLEGTVAVGVASSGSTTTYVENYASLASTLSPGRTWSYSGRLDVVDNAGFAAMTAEDGFQLTVTDTADATRNRVWNFTCNLTSTTGSGGGVTLQGTYTFKVDSSNSVTVTIDAQNPLVWAAGSAYPATGRMVISDSRTAQTNPESVTAVFANGQVTINGGIIKLGKS